LLGQQWLSVHGLSLGSAWSPEILPDDPDSYRGDRHELAHAALDWFRKPESDPPCVLNEGWAMAQCGLSRFQLAQAAAKARAEKPELGIRDLFGPSWYHQSSGPVYSMGGAFVEFLIRTFDARRFRKFYTECTPSHFDSKCREIFQIQFDELEAEFWNDVTAALHAEGQAESTRPKSPATARTKVRATSARNVSRALGTRAHGTISVENRAKFMLT
jgi:hypothetical protein